MQKDSQNICNELIATMVCCVPPQFVPAFPFQGCPVFSLLSFISLPCNIEGKYTNSHRTSQYDTHHYYHLLGRKPKHSASLKIQGLGIGTENMLTPAQQ